MDTPLRKYTERGDPDERRLLGDLPYRIRYPRRGAALSEHIEHAAYECYVFVCPESLKPDWIRDRIMGEIAARGVPCFSGSCSEVYREKAFEGISGNPGWRLEQPLPIARELGETSLMFLCHPTLTAAEIEKTCRVLGEVMAEADRID